MPYLLHQSRDDEDQDDDEQDDEHEFNGHGSTFQQ